MTAERVRGEQNEVDGENERPDADAKFTLAARRILEPHCLPEVVSEHEQEQHCDVEKVRVDVLHDQREPLLAPITLARFADGTGRRIGPESPVVGSAVVVAGEAKERWKR